MQCPIFAEHMPHKLPKSTSDDSHLAGDSKQSENKDFAGIAAEMTEGTSDDTHLAADSERQENAAGTSGYAPPVQEELRVASDGNSYTFQQFLDYYGEEWSTSKWNHLPRIGDMDQNFGDEGEVTIEVVELWELEKCKCPEGTPPMRKLVAGEKTLRCSQCGRPARKLSTD